MTKNDKKEIPVKLINPADYLKPETWADLVGLSGRRVRVLLTENRIPEAISIDGKEFIHKAALSPSLGNGRPKQLKK